MDCKSYQEQVLYASAFIVSQCDRYTAVIITTGGDSEEAVEEAAGDEAKEEKGIQHNSRGRTNRQAQEPMRDDSPNWDTLPHLRYRLVDCPEVESCVWGASVRQIDDQVGERESYPGKGRIDEG